MGASSPTKSWIVVDVPEERPLCRSFNGPKERGLWCLEGNIRPASIRRIDEAHNPEHPMLPCVCY
jgi:hypothetical protein